MEFFEKQFGVTFVDAVTHKPYKKRDSSESDSPKKRELKQKPDNIHDKPNKISLTMSDKDVVIDKKQAVKSAIGSVELDGPKISVKMKKLLADYDNDKITADELMVKTISLVEEYL